jgi:hypothetical protein
MDLICTHCGEPWDMDAVLHDEPQNFKRSGAAIVACPACKENGPAPTDLREKLVAAREVGELLGDDVDGYAAELEDLGLT